MFRVESVLWVRVSKFKDVRDGFFASVDVGMEEASCWLEMDEEAEEAEIEDRVSKVEGHMIGKEPAIAVVSFGVLLFKVAMVVLMED